MKLVTKQQALDEASKGSGTNAIAFAIVFLAEVLEKKL